MEKYRKTHFLPGNEAGIAEAMTRLTKGQLVALPTETVYGLGARADDAEAIQAIFQAKERPANHPLIVHLGDIKQFTEWASDVPGVVIELAKAFCPGPLTFILPLNANRDRAVTGGQDWVGLRIPSHPLTLEILRRSGLGIALPSANRFGRISPTSAADVLEELDGRVDAILDGGLCPVGIESTIIKVDTDQIVLLRPGRIRPEAIEAVAGQPVRIPEHVELRVSGRLDSHYAPIKPAYRLQYDQLNTVHPLWGADDWILSSYPIPAPVIANGTQVKMLPDEPNAYATQLYSALRQGDALTTVKRLWVIEPADTPEWSAVRDRLIRATRSVS